MKERCPNVGAILGGAETISPRLDGTGINPKIIPAIAVKIIPKKMAPLIPRVIKIAETTKPNTASNVVP